MSVLTVQKCSCKCKYECKCALKQEHNLDKRTVMSCRCVMHRIRVYSNLLSCPVPPVNAKTHFHSHPQLSVLRTLSTFTHINYIYSNYTDIVADRYNFLPKIEI